MSKLSKEQKDKLKKYSVFLLMGIIFLGSMWLIFAPSEEDRDKELQGVGFNADIPDPKQDEIIGDKQSAYEQEQMKQKEQERMQSLQSYADILESSQNEKINISLPDEDTQLISNQPTASKTPISNSVSAYQDINKTLGNFYEKPKDDPEKEEMKRKLEELEAKLEEQQSSQTSMDDQLLLMEKSYEMASKYMPQTQNQGNPLEQQGSSNNSLSNRLSNYGKNNQSEKSKVTPVRQIQNQTVSALQQEFTNSELFVMYDQVRNTGFNTLGGETGVSEKNTISAVVQGEQTLIDGQSVRLRLTEPLMAGTVFIPANTGITGQAKIQGERLEIFIASIEYKGTILPVELTVYDSDGQKGIYIPGSLELNAGKEILANMGNSVGTSFTMTQSASSQIASDVSKGAIQGVSAYMQKKIRQVKVTLKSGYQIMLMPKQ